MIRDENAPPRADDAAEDGEEEAPPMKRVPITTWVSPGVEALANLLQTNRTLRTLRIGHNHLYPESATALFKGIRGNGALLELSLEGNPIGFGDDTATFGLLLDALQTMPQIERLNVANTGCAAAVAAAPADKVACLFRIAHVDLGFNAFGRTPGALRSLAAAAKQCQAHNVKSLTLDGNHFDAAAMPEMPGYLLDVVGTVLRRLEAFSIAGNPKLGTQTCRDLLKLLGTGPALRRVSVRGSRADVADSGARLVEAAGYLAELDLGDIVATEAGAVDVCAAAVKSSTLASLALWSRDTDLGSAVMAHLAQHPPRTLTQVDAGCRRPTGREPTDDSDHAFDVEDVESALLANRLRACRRVS